MVRKLLFFLTSFCFLFARPTQASVTKNVQIIIFDPILTTQNNQDLITYAKWNDPKNLSTQIAAVVNKVSGGFVTYNFAYINTVKAIPIKADGFSYAESNYLTCLTDHSLCHSPDLVDYAKILSDFHSCTKLNKGLIDEVWLWGAPYFGYWESTLTGPNAFWYNSPPIMGTDCKKLLPIMGFSYERGLSEALHGFGHRTEATMTNVSSSAWSNFTASYGTVHVPPNTKTDYDYSNPAVVNGINCQTWGCSQEGYLVWWLSNLPQAPGSTNKIYKNWWRYVVDYDNSVK